MILLARLCLAGIAFYGVVYVLDWLAERRG